MTLSWHMQFALIIFVPLYYAPFPPAPPPFPLPTPNTPSPSTFPTYSVYEQKHTVLVCLRLSYFP